MAYPSLSDFIHELEKNNELIRVDKFVDPVLEISEITDRFSKLPDGGKALLFTENGTRFPVLTNMMGSLNRLNLSFGINKLEDVNTRMEEILGDLKKPGKSFFDKLSLLPKLAKISAFFPSEYKGKAPVHEVIIRDPDLDILPVLKTWPYDGGRFFTLPMVITTDPETGDRNVGMYRLQVFDKKTTGMHWHRHKTGANHYLKYKERGQIMPVAVALGGDPVLTYSATAPLPENIDEFLFAGFLRQKRVTLTKAVSQDIHVPAEADIIIEGYVDPGEEKVLEGPFGDHTGFYSLEDYYPLFHVTAITHRKNAIFPATLVGIPPQEDARIALATEKIFSMPIRQAIVPELEEMKIPDFGVAHNLTLVKIRKTYPGQARKVMNALWGAGQMMFNKVLVVTDKDTDIENKDVLLNKLQSLNPRRDLVFSEGPLDVLDHASEFTGFGGKLGIDLTEKLPEEMPAETEYDYFEAPDLPDPVARIIKKSFIYTENKDPVFCLMNIKKFDSYKPPLFRNQLLTEPELEPFPYLFFTDQQVSIEKLEEFLWYVLNNIEIRRDITIVKLKDGKNKVLIDGSSKIMTKENFPREWPNIVTMSPEVINKIDKNWTKLGLGEFIKSPSSYYSSIRVTSGASIRKR